MYIDPRSPITYDLAAPNFNNESYLHLFFKLDNGVVKAFIECRKFKCGFPVSVDPGNQVFINAETPPF